MKNPYLHILMWCLRHIITKQKEHWHCEPPNAGEPCIFVCNHEHAYGPVAMCTSFSYTFRPWADGAMRNVITARRFIHRTLIRDRSWPFLVASFFVSYSMVLPAMEALRELRAIPTYHDRRVVKTINMSVDSLIQGDNNVIFPENQELPPTDTVRDFNLGFTHIAKEYFQRCGKRLAFYPVCIHRENSEIHIGAPILYDPEIPSHHQKELIGGYLRDEIKRMLEQYTDTLKELPAQRQAAQNQ